MNGNGISQIVHSLSAIQAARRLGPVALAMLALCCVVAAGEAPPTTAPADFVYTQRGQIPLILSAPHGGDRPLPVNERTTGIRSRDGRTYQITLALADELEALLGKKPYVVAARFERRFIDANRQPADAYEDERAVPYYRAYHDLLRAYVDECREKWPDGAVLLDIHGQSKDREFIHRGTSNTLTAKRLTDRDGMDSLIGPESIFGILAERGYNVFPPTTQPAEREAAAYNGGFIVRTYGTRQPDGIDAIQIELGLIYRDGGAVQRRLVKDLAEAIARFYQRHVISAPQPSTRPAD